MFGDRGPSSLTPSRTTESLVSLVPPQGERQDKGHKKGLPPVPHAERHRKAKTPVKDEFTEFSEYGTRFNVVGPEQEETKRRHAGVRNNSSSPRPPLGKEDSPPDPGLVQEELARAQDAVAVAVTSHKPAIAPAPVTLASLDPGNGGRRGQTPSPRPAKRHRQQQQQNKLLPATAAPSSANMAGQVTYSFL